MLPLSPVSTGQAGFFDITDQLDSSHALLALGNELDWSGLEDKLGGHYSHLGRSAKPIRLMAGLLMLKQLYNLSDESVVAQWQMNPYFQVFCGETSFQACVPCHPTDLVKFRNRIGSSGVNAIFGLSVKLHGSAAQETTVLIDTTVQEKAITYPTDTKLAIKVINRLNKLAKLHGVKQRRTFRKEVRQLRVSSRLFNSRTQSGKAKRALKRLRTIAGKLMRELERKLPESVLAEQQANFALYQRALTQNPKDKNKLYSLHEPDVYCVGKGKAHKPYEYGKKASVVSTLENNIIVGVESHDEHVHDSKTIEAALNHAHSHRSTQIKTAVVDRGYRGCKQYVEQEVILPSAPLKRDNEDQRKRKKTLCQQRSGIEPIIGHLKHDYRLQRNYLKGSQGDKINLLMAACAWNLRKWLVAFFLFENNGQLTALMLFKRNNEPIQACWLVPTPS